MTVPGAEVSASRPHGLDRVDDQQGRRSAILQGGDNVFDAGFCRQFDWRVGKPEPLGAQPHLGNGFLTGNVDNPLAARGKRCASLDQQCGFADARFAAEQDD